VELQRVERRFEFLLHGPHRGAARLRARPPVSGRHPGEPPEAHSRGKPLMRLKQPHDYESVGRASVCRAAPHRNREAADLGLQCGARRPGVDE